MTYILASVFGHYFLVVFYSHFYKRNLTFFAMWICIHFQKYEMIKTEDIPHLEHSTFSTRVVKDIAQNILSFLKSNCTKEGHTYWLFKGRLWREEGLYLWLNGSLTARLMLSLLYLNHSQREWHREALRSHHSVWGGRRREMSESLHSSCGCFTLQVSNQIFSAFSSFFIDGTVTKPHPCQHVLQLLLKETNWIYINNIHTHIVVKPFLLCTISIKVNRKLYYSFVEWQATWCWRRGKTESTTERSELCSWTVSNSWMKRGIPR